MSSRVKVIQQITEVISGATGTSFGQSINMDGSQGFSVQSVTSGATGSFQLQKSNDNLNWDTDGSTVVMSGSETHILEKSPPKTLWMRLKIVVTSGSATMTNTYISKGLN